jgi:homoserine dehydrogenase
VTVARNRLRGAVGPGESSYAARPVSRIGSVLTRYHVLARRLDVVGVLATIAMSSPSTGVDRNCATERAGCRRPARVGEPSLHATLPSAPQFKRYEALDVVRQVTSVMRVEGD